MRKIIALKTYFFYLLSSSKSDQFKDCLFITITTFLSCAFYIGNLGFYSDDFGFLNRFSQVSDQSLIGIFSSSYPNNANFWMRPAQVIVYASQYLLFGFHPLGYHLVNTTILILGFLLLYLVLRELLTSRLLAFSTSIVYTTLPNYSSNRFWFTASNISLSMTLYFLSLYSLLISFKARQLSSFWIWQFLAIISMVFSILNYEAFLPLFIFNIIVLLSVLIYRNKKKFINLEENSFLKQKLLIFAGGINIITFLLVTIFKWLVSYPSGKVRAQLNSCLAQEREDCMDIRGLATHRFMNLYENITKLIVDNFHLALLGFLILFLLLFVSCKFYHVLGRLIRKPTNKFILYGSFTVISIYIIHRLQLYIKYSHNSNNFIGLAISWWINLAQGIIAINYIDYGFRLPQVTWQIVHNYSNWNILILGIILGLSIGLYCYQIIKSSDNKLFTKKDCFRLIILGSILFILGYIIFLTNKKFFFTATGVGNRTAIASTVGIALSWVGLISSLSLLLPISKSWRKISFCTLITLLCMSGILINNSIASLWVKAHLAQQEVLAKIQQVIPSIPYDETTILVDEICPYIGPAPIFEGNIDITPALRLVYHNQTLTADVVKPRMQVKEEGIVTRMYGNEVVYPYKKLMIYNFRYNTIIPIENAEDGNNYFQKFNPTLSKSCPKSYEGQGVTIFD